MCEYNQLASNSHVYLNQHQHSILKLHNEGEINELLLISGFCSYKEFMVEVPIICFSGYESRLHSLHFLNVIGIRCSSAIVHNPSQDTAIAINIGNCGQSVNSYAISHYHLTIISGKIRNMKGSNAFTVIVGHPLQNNTTFGRKNYLISESHVNSITILYN